MDCKNGIRVSDPLQFTSELCVNNISWNNFRWMWRTSQGC